MPDVHQTPVGDVRIVALSRISPGPDFNPRTARDPGDTEREQALADVEAVRRYSVEGYRLRKAARGTGAYQAGRRGHASEEPGAQAD